MADHDDKETKTDAPDQDAARLQAEVQAAEAAAKAHSVPSKTSGGSSPNGDGAEPPSTDDGSPPEPLAEKYVQAAKHLGYTDEEIGAMSPDQAETIFEASVRKRRLEASRGRDQKPPKGGKKTEGAAGDGEPDKGSPPPAEPADDTGAPSDDDALPEFGLSEDDMLDEAKVLEALKGLHKLTHEQARELKRLQRKLSSSGVETADGEAERFFQEADPDRFGEGPTDRLRTTSPERKARESVRRKADVLREHYEQEGQPKTYRECLEEAAGRANRHGQPAAAADADADDDTRQALARPTGGRKKIGGDTVTDEIRAAETLARRKGLPVP